MGKAGKLEGHEADIRRMAKAGMDPTAIGAVFGASRTGVLRKMRLMGIPYERRRTGRPPSATGDRRRAADWMAARRIEMGDMLDVMNCAGQTYTGRLVDIRWPLGYICLAGDPHFAFSLVDAHVKRSKSTKVSTFVSRIPRGPLDWATEMPEIVPASAGRYKKASTDGGPAWMNT